MNTLKAKKSKKTVLLVIKRFLGFASVIVLLLILSGCSSSKLRVAEYEFVYNGTRYTLRSAYYPNNPNSCNSLIGKNFEAEDVNLDGIMDKIIKGNINLSEAQEIYDYSLGMLQRQGGLKQINKKSKEFTLNKSYYKFSIKSFSPESGPFNEFTVVNRKPSLYSFKTSVFVDRGADGKLDEVLKGSILLRKAQKMYEQTISEGLKKTELVKYGKIILVR